MLAQFRPARQEKRQVKIRRAAPISRPVSQESRITAATHRGIRYRANPHSNAVPSYSSLTHSGAHLIRSLQMQCRTILFCRLPLRAARHSLSAAQEKVRCSLRIQKPRSSAIPLCRLRTRQVRSQQQNIRIGRKNDSRYFPLHIRLRRTRCYSLCLPHGGHFRKRQVKNQKEKKGA